MGDEKCDDARYSLCSSGKITIGGPSKFVLDAGFYVGGGASLKLGLGTSNSYTIGKSSGRNAVALGGGAVAVMADANTGKGIFRLNGDLNGGGGGSCITLPASAEHDISGNVNLAGGAKLGSGTYTIDGYFSVNTGGASCSDNVAVAGKDVTIIVSGVDTPSGSDCNKKSFCLTGGNAITLNAPKAGAYADLAIIGPQSSTKKAGAVITSGGQAKISGAFYFPNGTVEFGGGGTDRRCQQWLPPTDWNEHFPVRRFPGYFPMHTTEQGRKGGVAAMIAFSKTRIGRWFATLGRARAALKDKTGNATIEFALVIPLFAVIVVGSADIGMLIFSRFKLGGAVSASASYAVAHVDQVDSANGGALAKNLVSIVANNSSDDVDVLVDINNDPQAVNEGAKVTLDGQPARADACYCPKGTP